MYYDELHISRSALYARIIKHLIYLLRNNCSSINQFTCYKANLHSSYASPHKCNFYQKSLYFSDVTRILIIRSIHSEPYTLKEPSSIWVLGKKTTQEHNIVSYNIIFGTVFVIMPALCVELWIPQDRCIWQTSWIYELSCLLSLPFWPGYTLESIHYAST